MKHIYIFDNARAGDHAKFRVAAYKTFTSYIDFFSIF